jgi:hypothetical protein
MGDGGSTLLLDTLITSRDGIVGPWRPPEAIPAPLTANDPRNIGFWGPVERTSLYHSDLLSRISFTTEDDGVSVHHLEPTDGGMQHKPLVTLVRPSETTFKTQLKYLHDYAELRPDRGAEVIAQLGHPTPFLAAIAFLHPERTRWTLELLYAAGFLCALSVLSGK